MSSTINAQQAVRRWGAGTAATVRLLVAADVPLTGVAIAAEVGVTQPRVSQVLKQLTGQRAVTATPAGYVGDPAILLELYRTRARPHLVEPERHWYSTRPLVEQAQRVMTLAFDHRAAIAFSADLAPDLVAPWRHPTVTIAYVDASLPFEDAGFVPAEGRADASLAVRWTDDRGLGVPAEPWADTVDGFPIVDPCQQWWDLLDLGGEDRVEGAERLRQAILGRALPRTDGQ